MARMYQIILYQVIGQQRLIAIRCNAVKVPNLASVGKKPKQNHDFFHHYLPTYTSFHPIMK